MVKKPHQLKLWCWRDLLRVGVGLGVSALLLLPAGDALARGPWRASEDNTRGWQLMSPEERIEHQAKIRGFRKYDECHAYQLEHHRRMAERAIQRGVRLQQRQRDICADLLAVDGRR